MLNFLQCDYDSSYVQVNYVGSECVEYTSRSIISLVIGDSQVFSLFGLSKFQMWPQNIWSLGMSIKLSDSDPFSWISLTPEISKGNQWLCLIIIIIIIN